MEAERGDYRAASAAGTKATVLTLGAAVGLGEGLAALGGRAGAAGAARGAVGELVGGGGQLLRHYTSENGFKAIMESGMIRAPTSGAHAGRVFATPLAVDAATAEQVIFRGFASHAGRGSHVIEFTPKPGVFFDAGRKPNELIHRGTVRFGRRVEITSAGPNPF
ncbi:HYD1 signature containing ADP-ribosyltransferase family protein [Sorangium sp. So ce1128]